MMLKCVTVLMLTVHHNVTMFDPQLMLQTEWGPGPAVLHVLPQVSPRGHRLHGAPLRPARGAGGGQTGQGPRQAEASGECPAQTVTLPS